MQTRSLCLCCMVLCCQTRVLTARKYASHFLAVFAALPCAVLLPGPAALLSVQSVCSVLFQAHSELLPRVELHTQPCIVSCLYCLCRYDQACNAVFLVKL